MNINVIKTEIEKNVGKNVQVVVYGMRNKNTSYIGNIKNIYPNVFSISTKMGDKCFSYTDVCIGDVKIKYLS